MDADWARVEELRAAFRYENGMLYWKTNPGSRRKAGSPAGGKEVKGHFRVALRGRRLKAHRVIWEILNGPIPAGMQIDHIDGDRGNNRIENLRLATNAQNCMNKRAVSGKKGATFVKARGEWAARIRLDGKHLYLGSFATEDEAHAAYARAAQHYFGEYARA